MDLKLFLAAVANDWLALLSSIGSVALLILGISVFYKKPIPRYVVLVVAALCFVAASVRAWTTEHNARVRAESELNQSVPDLQGTIERFSVSGEAIDRNKLSVVSSDEILAVLIVTIRNLGTPSIARNWNMILKTKDGRSLTARLRALPEQLSLGVGNLIQTFASTEALYDKAMAAPIPEGGAVTGVLLFDLTGIKRDDVFQDGNSINVTFEDVRNKPNVATLRLSSHPDSEVHHYPGLKESITPMHPQMP